MRARFKYTSGLVEYREVTSPPPPTWLVPELPGQLLFGLHGEPTVSHVGPVPSRSDSVREFIRMYYEDGSFEYAEKS